jgi:hypothetical protein
MIGSRTSCRSTDVSGTFAVAVCCSDWNSFNMRIAITRVVETAGN